QIPAGPRKAAADYDDYRPFIDHFRDIGHASLPDGTPIEAIQQVHADDAGIFSKVSQDCLNTDEHFHSCDGRDEGVWTSPARLDYEFSGDPSGGTRRPYATFLPPIAPETHGDADIFNALGYTDKFCGGIDVPEIWHANSHHNYSTDDRSGFGAGLANPDYVSRCDGR